MSDADNKAEFGSFFTGFTHPERLNMPELAYQTYLNLVEPLCKEVEDQTGIIHIVPMIQSAHESRSGNSSLAKEYGNLFGFKATENWKQNGKPVADLPTWEIVNTDTPEKYKDFTPTLIEKYYDKGKELYKLKIVLKQEFKIYETWRESFFDWGRLISTVKAYRIAYPLLKRKDTVREGIKAMAEKYATDHNYANKLLLLYDRIDSGIR